MKPVNDAGDLEKNATGPEFRAPENPDFSSSNDEFAGAYARDGAVLLADRDGADYPKDTEAYRFGSSMAADSRFEGREWAQVESDLETEWAKQSKGDWKQRQPDVRQGWMEARGMG